MLSAYHMGRVFITALSRKSILLTTIRHPAFTPESRLVTGDLLARTCFSWMRVLNPLGARWESLIWEAHKRESDTIVALKWTFPQLLGKQPVTMKCGLKTIPWWFPASDLEVYVNKVLNNPQWQQLEQLGSKLGRSVARRVQEVHEMYRHALGGSSGTLTAATYRLYRDFATLTVGHDNVPLESAQPFRSRVARLVLPTLDSLGEERFQAAISRLCPNGDKRLFLGSQGNRLLYIGWSNKRQQWGIQTNSLTSSSKRKSKPTTLSNIRAEIARGQLIPIGWAATLLLLIQERIAHHGNEYGRRQILERKLGLKAGLQVFKDNTESWPFMVITESGIKVTPGLHEIYILFGRQHPLVLQALNRSMRTGKPTCVPLSAIREERQKRARRIIVINLAQSE